ncbi:hypothetical protein [Ammoniphilus sp. 3BR4]|uniref:hypothetical protein n=1 Tax=Ammoniphilus sp. 3BR4 TaxID=3158265 RepID=UPI00346795B5
MKFKGVIYKKRAYVDREKPNVTDILFIELEEKIDVNGETIRIIPILSYKPSSYRVGEQVEVNGEVRFESILTSTGKRSFSPIPVIRVAI